MSENGLTAADARGNVERMIATTKKQALSTSEQLRRQIGEFNRQRVALTVILAEVFSSRKSGAAPLPILSERAQAARARAVQLLGGQAPDHLKAPKKDHEAELLAERDGLDLVLGILQERLAAELTAEADAWALAHDADWRELVREWFHCALRLEALDEKASDMLRAVASGTHGFPFSQYLGLGLSVPIPGVNIQIAAREAIESGVLSKADVKRAETT